MLFGLDPSWKWDRWRLRPVVFCIRRDGGGGLYRFGVGGGRFSFREWGWGVK